MENRKMRGFGMLKPSPTMPCAMNSRLSAIQKQIEIRLQKGSQKSSKIDKNRPLGRPGAATIAALSPQVGRRMAFWPQGRPHVSKNID